MGRGSSENFGAILGKTPSPGPNITPAFTGFFVVGHGPFSQTSNGITKMVIGNMLLRF